MRLDLLEVTPKAANMPGLGAKASVPQPPGGGGGDESLLRKSPESNGSGDPLRCQLSCAEPELDGCDSGPDLLYKR